jgi:hypothetical protein
MGDEEVETDTQTSLLRSLQVERNGILAGNGCGREGG